MQLVNGVVLDRRQMDDRIALVAAIAQHLGYNLANVRIGQPAVFQEQRTIGSRRQRPVVRRNHHGNLEIARQADKQIVQSFAVRVIEIARRLVGQEHHGINGQRSRDGGTLLFPS
jgi:hypothetical protein